MARGRRNSAQSLKKFSRNSSPCLDQNFIVPAVMVTEYNARSAANGGLAATMPRNRNFSRVDWIAGIGTQVHATSIIEAGTRHPLKVASSSSRREELALSLEPSERRSRSVRVYAFPHATRLVTFVAPSRGTPFRSGDSVAILLAFVPGEHQLSIRI
jgi:hypothetical protein